MKNTTYIEKCLEYDVVTYILTFTKRVLYLIFRKKIAFWIKKRCFIGHQNQRFRLKKGCFFFQNPRKGGVFQTWVRAWYTLWSGVGDRAPNAFLHMRKQVLQAYCRNRHAYKRELSDVIYCLIFVDVDIGNFCVLFIYFMQLFLMLENIEILQQWCWLSQK